MRMLITRSKPIQDLMMLECVDKWIEEHSVGTDELSKQLLLSNKDEKEKILRWRKEEEVYRSACEDYAKITTLLFD